MALIGKPLDRIDGRLKVTGAARYSAEFNQANMAYGFPIRSTIANGTIRDFNIEAAERSEGVLSILTYRNAPRLRAPTPQVRTGGVLGDFVLPLQNNRIYAYGQYIGMVVAETYEQARAAANLVTVFYDRQEPAIDLEKELPKGTRPELNTAGMLAQVNVGEAAPVIDASPVKIEHEYVTSNQNHHPMEPHATIAIWEGANKLTIYDATQNVGGVRGNTAYLFNLEPTNVTVLSYYIGGAFGSKALQYNNIFLTVMAARVVNRPVKFALTRQMMPTNVGRRPQTIQTISLGADRAGNLTALRHHTDSYRNLSTYFENTGSQSLVVYKAPVREISYRITTPNIGPPNFMRAPGEEPGSFALESAMDELAYELKMDPLALRVLNHTPVNPETRLPFSSEHLLECYSIGAEKIGWSKRNPVPGQQRNGRYLVGYGMATAEYPAARRSAAARVRMMPDGSIRVMTATHDIGTGMYTILAQTAGDALGLPIERITVLIGDSSLPPAPGAFGSVSTASVLPAVFETGKILRTQLLDVALADRGSRLAGRRPDEIAFSDGRFFLRADPSVGDAYADIMRRSNRPMLEVTTLSMPAAGPGFGPPAGPFPLAPYDLDQNSNTNRYAFNAFGAQFAEVWVDQDLGIIRIKRFVSVMDIGQLMNEKTARSQIIGSVIYGIGSALMEETNYDMRYANPVTRTLADYHVPVHLDTPPIEVHFIGKPDPHISPLGAKGGGEIGTVGVSAAIANAVFNATGKRIRELPLTPDKVF